MDELDSQCSLVKIGYLEVVIQGSSGILLMILCRLLIILTCAGYFRELISDKHPHYHSRRCYHIWWKLLVTLHFTQIVSLFEFLLMLTIYCQMLHFTRVQIFWKV
jgi:hypothetical protein